MASTTPPEKRRFVPLWPMQGVLGASVASNILAAVPEGAR